MNPQSVLSNITTFMKYARYDEVNKKRENWLQIVNRNKAMHINKFPELKDVIEEVYEYVLDKKVLPSMRSMQFAGKAIEANPARMYNCSYLPIDSVHSFSESMFLLLSGTGVGYSVQKHHIEQLPPVRKLKGEERYLIEDSIEGWADSIKVLMKSYFGMTKGKRFDYSKIREKGSLLVTSGGKAPGAEPLKNAHKMIVEILSSRENMMLRSIDCHDIMCHIADAVLAGGIRRAAMISLFSKEDEMMLMAKSSNIETNIIDFNINDVLKSNSKTISLKVEQGGIIKNVDFHKTNEKFFDLEQYLSDGTLGWWVCNSQRGRANNSVMIERDKITKNEFLSLWKRIEESNSGEPGYYLTNSLEMGTNPCVEIGLIANQFCNLTEINGTDIKSEEDFLKRVECATILGTLQATYTDFHYLRSEWKENTEKEALLGVSITGIASMEVFNFSLKKASSYAKEINKKYAQLLGINQSKRITCVKPSGTASLVLGTSSGIHAWYSKYYIRRIRVDKNESIYAFLLENCPSVLEDDFFAPNKTAIISIPQKAPDGAITRDSQNAIQFLEMIKDVNCDWVRNGHNEGLNTHNVSATVNIKNDEWENVGNWMWENKDYYNGLSVIPYDNGSYKQTPFEEIDGYTYNKLLNEIIEIDTDLIREEFDDTNLIDQVACAGGACEI